MRGLELWNSVVGRVGRRGGALGSGALAIADYAIVSLSKFLIVVLVGRYASPAEFGVFVLAFSLLTFANSLQIGVAGEPLVVFGATASPERAGRLIGAGLAWTGILFAATALLCLAVAAALLAAGGSVVWLLALLAITLPVQLQDLARRVFFTRSQVQVVLWNDVLLAALMGAGFLALLALGQLSATAALLLIGAASLVTSLLAWARIARETAGGATAYRCDRSDMGEMWQYSRWSLGSQIAFNLSTQGYLYAAGLLLGPAGAAALRAAQNLLIPIQLMLVGVESPLIVRAGRTYQQAGKPGLSRLMLRVGAAMVAGTALYVTVVTLSAEPLMHLIYNGKYGEHGLAVAGYGIFYVAFAASRPFAFGLRALHRPAAIFHGYLWTLALTVLLVLPLVYLLGVGGAALGNGVTGLAFCAVVAWSYWRSRPVAGPSQTAGHA